MLEFYTQKDTDKVQSITTPDNQSFGGWCGVNQHPKEENDSILGPNQVFVE